MHTRQYLYEMYHAGQDVMLRYVESLLAHLAEVERHVGHRQQYTIDSLAKRVQELMARVARLKTKVAKQEILNHQLRRRVQELQTELARRDRDGGEGVPVGVRRDSHNSGLPPSLDLPRVKAANAVKRTRSLRRKSDRRVGGQVGHKGVTLRQVEFPDHVQVHEPRLCRRCCSSLRESSVVGRQRHQVFDLPPVVLEVTAALGRRRSDVTCAACEPKRSFRKA